MGEQDGSYKFAFAVMGTRGDFQPYLSLGLNLASRGHKVKFYTPITHCKTAAKFGMDAVLTGGDVQEGLQNENAKEAMEKGDFALIVRAPKPGENGEEKEPELIDGKTIEEIKQEAKKDFLEFRPHVYATNGLGHVWEFDEVLGEKEIVQVSLALQPQGGPPTNRFNSIIWAREFPEPDTPKICTHLWLLQSQARQAHQTLQYLAMVGQLNEEMLDNFGGPETIFRHNIEVEKRVAWHILAYSTHVFPPPSDWPDVLSKSSRTRQIGRMHFTREQQDEISRKQGNDFFATSTDAHEECKAFIAKGPAPVYIGWGSMSVYTSEHMTFLAVEALKMAGQRGIILSGWAELSFNDLQADRPGAEECRAYATENILFMKSAPHEWLFPQCSCCVHHGGIGTMQASLGAGTPTIITPVFADQELNGEYLAEGGWGLTTSRLGKLKSKELGTAIKTVCTDPSFKEKTQDLYRKMEQEDGIGEATEMLERVVREEALTGKFKELCMAEKLELRQKREKELKLSTEAVLARWNSELNKRYPSWMEYNRRNMVFAASCNEALESGRLWCVSASSCLVREGEALKSPEVGRFKKNAFLEQVDKKGSRIRVKKVRGYGPEEGWVSPTTSGKDILENIKDMARITTIQTEMYNALFADLVAPPQQ